MSEGLGENSRLLDFSGKLYNQEDNGNVLQLRDWLDDPYEQVGIFKCVLILVEFCLFVLILTNVHRVQSCIVWNIKCVYSSQCTLSTFLYFGDSVYYSLFY